MISGVCNYLRRQGFRVTEKQEDERIRMFNLYVFYDEQDSLTACTDGQRVIINAGTKLLSCFDGQRELRHYAVQGMRVHEVGHILFTDNPTKLAWLNELSAGRFWPNPPQNITTQNGAQLMAKMQDEQYRDILVSFANILRNSLEDGYIEREMVEMYGGLAATELATLNDAMLMSATSFEEDLKNDDSHPLLALASQLLLYAKFDFMYLGTYPEEYNDIIDECVFIVDETKYERDPKSRVSTVNELLCVLFPYLDDFIEETKKKLEQEKKNQQQSSQPSGAAGAAGSGGASGSAGNAQGGGAGTSGNTDPSAQQVAEAVKQALQQVAKNAGASADTKGTSGSLANPGSSGNGGAQAKVSCTQNGGDASGASAPHTRVASSPGASTGEPDLSAGQYDIDSITKQRAENIANQVVEGEIANQMNKEAQSFNYAAILGPSGRNGVNVVRAADVSQTSVEKYNQMAQDLLVISKNIERRLKSLIRDEENDDTISGLTMGSRIEARTLYRQDGKCFSRKNFPREAPRLAVGYLCDESGSMSSLAISASIRAGIIIEDLCRRMELPCIIGGFTTAGSGAHCTFKSYVEPDSVDKNDRYRLTVMNSSGGTPTAYALIYMVNRLKKISCQNKIILVSTDGCSDMGAEVLQKVIKMAKQNGIIVIGAGIGSSRNAIQGEFGQMNYLDIEEIEKMPVVLCNIIKRNIMR